jgi:5-methylcytosine-specific restriction endonuclease McrA
VPYRKPIHAGQSPLTSVPTTSRSSSKGGGQAAERSGAGAQEPPRRRVLLLNNTFEPLTALPLRRAVVLVVCGKAEVVHGDAAGLVLHSATTTVEVPSVIRLSNFVRVPYRGRVPLSRAALMLRDGHRCAYCSARAETIDHVVPRSRGGSHSWENCVACCAKCNRRKADKTLNELGWTLSVAPKAPRGRNWRLLAGSSDPDPLWLPYLNTAA